MIDVINIMKPSLNRTKVGLKVDEDTMFAVVLICLNRTKVGLKVGWFERYWECNWEFKSY